MFISSISHSSSSTLGRRILTFIDSYRPINSLLLRYQSKSPSPYWLDLTADVSDADRRRVPACARYAKWVAEDPANNPRSVIVASERSRVLWTWMKLLGLPAVQDEGSGEKRRQTPSVNKLDSQQRSVIRLYPATEGNQLFILQVNIRESGLTGSYLQQEKYNPGKAYDFPSHLDPLD